MTDRDTPVTEPAAVFMDLADPFPAAGLSMFVLVPRLPMIEAYIERIGMRPAVMRARAKDAEPARQFG